MGEEFGDFLVRIQAVDQATGAYVLLAQPGDGDPAAGELRLDRAMLLENALDARRYGMALSEALLSGDVGRAYEDALRKAEARMRGRLRVRLRIDDQAAEAQAIAWERLHYLHHGRPVPVAVSQRTPFSRYTESDFGRIDKLATPVVHVLFAISNPAELPQGLQPLDVDEEVRAIHQAIGDLRDLDRIRVNILPGRTGLDAEVRRTLEEDGYSVLDGATSIRALTRWLSRNQIVHILSHGHFSRESPTGVGSAALYLERDDGRWEAVDDERLADRITALHPFCPHLIFLSACESAWQEPDLTHPLVGLGPKLIDAGVPAVVGMQSRVPASVARDLTVEFYRSLLEQGLVDVALNRARLFLFEGEEVDWAIPVLFSRLPDGRLFVPGELAGRVVTRRLAFRQTDHGARGDRRKQGERPVGDLRPVRALPRDYPDLLDREEEVRAASGALEAGRAVELYGEAGVGKTTLLRHIVHRVAGPDGVVHVSARGRPVEDLLQYLFDRLYRTDGSYRPTPGELRDLLAEARVLFALDDAELSREDVQRLMDAAPRAVFLLAARQANLLGEGETIQLRGLPEQAGVALLERHLGRQLDEQERSEAAALARALDGNPQEIIQAAARVRDEGVAVSQVRADEEAKRTGPPPPAIGVVDVPPLPEIDRQVLGVMAALGEAPVQPEHLEALTSEPDLTEVLTRLQQRGAVKAASPTFSLAERADPETERYLDAETWRERLLNHFLEWCQENRDDPGRIQGSLDAILATLEWARASGRRQEFLRLARLIEEAFIVGRRWGTWRALLLQQMEAAEILGDLEAHGWALHQLGTHSLGRGESGAARGYLRRALKLRKSLRDRAGARLTRHNLRLAQPFLLRWWSPRPVVVVAIAGLAAFGGWRFAVGEGTLSADPDDVSFADLRVGSTSGLKTVMVTNKEERAVVVKTVGLRGADAGDFLLDDRCSGGRLRSGESCTVEVRFHPTVGGDRSAQVVVVPSGGDELTVDLGGTGLVSVSLSAPSPVTEGNGEVEQSIGFTVSLSARSSEAVSVAFETVEGTATAGQDYEEQEGTLTLDPGDTEGLISVPIIGDDLDEVDGETFSLILSDPDGVEITEGEREGIIQDDDRAPSLAVASQSVTEVDEGSAEMTFVARLSAPSGRSVSVGYATEDGTAVAADDYGAIEGTLAWAPGETEQPVTVLVFADLLDEADETFSLRLSNLQGAQLPERETETEVTGTILDNDPLPSVSISGAPEVDEGSAANALFEVVLSAVSGLEVSVDFSTMEDLSAGLCQGSIPGRATPGSDYDDVEDDLVIPAGQISTSLAVPIIDDQYDECLTETFLVNLSTAGNALITKGQAVGTIRDDEGDVE